MADSPQLKQNKIRMAKSSNIRNESGSNGFVLSAKQYNE